MKIFQKAALAAALSVGIALTGCSSSDDNPSGGGGGGGVTMSGVAAKGLLLGAKVQACADTACETEILATAITDEKDGSYTLEIPNTFTGVAVIKVSHRDGAKMICDSSDCGKDFSIAISMEENLILRSAAAIEKSATKIEAHVSPLTELVVTAAAKSRESSGLGSLNTDSLNKGSKAVKDLLGLDVEIDIIGVKPIDITDENADVSNDVALQLSALSAAFASKSEGESIAAKIAKFAKAVTGESVTKKDLESLTTAATSSLTKAAKNNDKLRAKVDEINLQLTAKSKKATENCEVKDCSVEVVPAELDESEKTSLSNNVKAVKTLVADVRELGWEVYPTLRDAADPTKDGYNDNLIGQADEAAKTLDADLQTSFDGVAELLDIVTYAYLEANVETDVKTLASAYYKYAYENAWEYSQIYKNNHQQCIDDANNSDYLWPSTVEECERWYPVKNLDTDTANFAAQFAGTISKSGKVWTLVGATYNKDDKETTISRFEVTFPTATPSETAKSMSIGIKATAKHASSEVSLDATAKATFSEAISVEADANFYILTASINGDAKVTNKKDTVTRTFTGKVAFEGGTPQKQQNVNKDNADKVVSFLPKYASLEGKFTSSKYAAGVLEAKVTASLDNYETYNYHAEGTPVDVPVKLTLSKDNKTLELSLGEGDEKLSFTTEFLHHKVCDWYTVEDGVENCGSFIETNVLKFSQCKIGANASGECTWQTNNPEYPVQLSWYSDVKLTEGNTILDALNIYFDDNYWNSENFFWNRLYSSEYGYVNSPIIEGGLKETDFTNNVMELKAISTGSPTDKKDNYIQGTVTAEVTGKLSPNLPDVNLKFTAKRSEFSKATADLVINWTEPGKAQKVISFKADVLGNNGSFEKLGDDALNLYISDAKGTEFLLSDKGIDDKVAGYITKDGTKYATISKSGSAHYVTYHFDDKGNKADLESGLEFETIF